MRRRLGDTAPPATRSPRAPPLTIRVPAGHVVDAVVSVPAAPGPDAGAPATTRLRRPGPAGVEPEPGRSGVEPGPGPGVPPGPGVVPEEPPAAAADGPPPLVPPAAVAPVLPAGPGVVLRWAGLVLSPPLPPAAAADADGVTVADAPGEVVGAVEVASAWPAGGPDAGELPGLAARPWDVEHAGMSRRTRAASAATGRATGPVLVIVSGRRRRPSSPCRPGIPGPRIRPLPSMRWRWPPMR